ncbi:DUF1847 domain-containing protein [Chloroflexota bacterium]
MKDKQSTIMCSSCPKMECRLGYPGGIPSWCMATKYETVLEQTKKQYSEATDVNIYLAAGKVVRSGYGKWPRIQEAIEFAKALNLSKIGLASCVALSNELMLITELFTGAGFEVVSAVCQIGRIPPEDRGVTLDDDSDHRGLNCNPIAQAEICNSEGTELNYIIGLCLGHDILFTRHSKAPVSTLIVKDRVTGHNPAVALYASQVRQPIWKLYCD